MEVSPSRSGRLFDWLYGAAGGATVLYATLLFVYLLTAGARFDGVDGSLRLAVARMIFERGEVHVDVERNLPIIPQTLIWGDGAVRWLLVRKGVSPLALSHNDFAGIRSYFRAFSGVRVTPVGIWGGPWRALHPDATRAGSEGRIYAAYPLGHSLAMIPFYALGGERLAALTLAFIAPLVAVFVFLLLLHLGLSWSRSMATALVVGLASIVWPYAVSTHDAALSAVAVIGTLYFAVRQRDGGWGWSLLVGVCAGFAVMVKFSNVVVLPGVGLIWIGAWRNRIKTDSAATRRLLTGILLATCCVVLAILFDRWYQAVRFSGAVGYDFVGGLPTVAPRSGVARVLMRLKRIEWEGFLGLLVSPSKSVLLFTPPLLASLAVLHRFFRRDRWLAASLCAVFALSYCGHAMLPYWHGDYSWGPRYLVPVTALLLMPLCELRWTRRATRWITIALVGLSVLIQFSAASVDNDRYYAVRELPRGWHYDRKLRRDVYFSLEYIRPLEVLVDNWLLLGRTAAALDRIDRLPSGQKPTPRVFRSRKEWARLTDPRTGRLRRGVQPFLVLRSYYNLSDYWYVHGRYKRFAPTWLLRLLLALNLLGVAIGAALLAAAYWTRRRPWSRELNR